MSDIDAARRSLDRAQDRLSPLEANNDILTAIAYALIAIAEHLDAPPTLYTSSFDFGNPPIELRG